MLTDKGVRAAAPKDKAYKVSDSGGLFLHVSPKNHKSWRFKYRLGGKEQLLTLGTYPEVSLAEAREKRNDARKLLREGRDPRVSAKRAKLVGDSGTFQTLNRRPANGTRSRSRGGSRFTPRM